MPRLRTPLCDTLGLRLPIIQAPMAGGATTPALVTAVAKTGALGSFGFAYTQPEAMQRDCEAVRAETDAPFNLNLFVSSLPPAIPADAQRSAIDAVAGYYAELGLPPPAPVKPPYTPDLAAQLSVVEDVRPAVLTYHLGRLPADRIRSLQGGGTRVGGSATCVAEAEELEALGVDFIVAQGAEAGGHRGSYLRDPYDAMTGTFALVRLIARKVRTPVVAAGGIMDGAGIAAALALGAQAVQMGTAFLPCAECGIAPAYKTRLLAAREDETRITEKFSGKPARGLANRFMREMAAHDAPQLAFPAQNLLTGPMRAAASKAGNTDLVSMWCGQAVALSRALPAAALVEALEAETLECLDRLAALR
ncbi:MAG: NAD(P)H-dependent flavin oxidoreductase [Burkholderiales bacterium]